MHMFRFIFILTLLFGYPLVINAGSLKDYSVYATNLQFKVAKKLARKHKIKLCGMGGGMIDQVNKINLRFQINFPLTKEQLRRILVDCTEELLTAFNSDTKIRPYLCTYPFRNVSIIIFCSDMDRGSLFHPDISTVSFLNEVVTYRTSDEDGIRYKTEVEESYAEAKAIVERERQQFYQKNIGECLNDDKK